jgi:hypothetical protein
MHHSFVSKHFRTNKIMASSNQPWYFRMCCHPENGREDFEDGWLIQPSFQIGLSKGWQIPKSSPTQKKIYNMIMTIFSFFLEVVIAIVKLVF